MSTISPHTAGLPASSCLLAVNVTAAKPRHLLVLVDAVRAEELAKFAWKTSKQGHIFRTWYSRFNPGRQHYESLASRVTRPAWVDSSEPAASRTVAPVNSSSPTHYANGDSLDCRAGNLWVNCEPTNPKPRVAAGSTFVDTVAFTHAASMRLAYAAQLKALFPPHRRKPVLTDEQVKELLTAFRDLPVYHNKGYAYLLTELVQGIAPGVTYTAPQLRAVLRGEQQPVRGFDYAAIAQLLPKRSKFSNPNPE